jgi:Protein of unknown function (DUF3455)
MLRSTSKAFAEQCVSTAPVAASCVAAALALAGCATAPAPAAHAPSSEAVVAVPAALQAPPGERKLTEHHARGVQIYRCTAGAASASPAWAFVAPQAELFGSAASSAVVGTHGAGPFWQAADGSKVVGQVKARADAPQAGAIPWLLLSAVPQSAAGSLAAVTSIQRLQTVGGVAPAAGCASTADVGSEVRVPYTAQYVYYVRG